MSKMVEIKKLHLSPLRIILIGVITFLIFESIFYCSMQFTDGTLSFWPLKDSFFIYTPVLLLVTVGWFIFSYTNAYYELTKDGFVHVKMQKRIEYKYSEIVYIDEKYSKKHKMLLFYCNDGKERLLGFDKNGVIFEKCMQHCNLMSKEEFMERFRKVKL